MRELPDGRTPVKGRLVLGFDDGCSACAELARRIKEQVSTGRLEVLGLREPPADEWRTKTLGKDAPLVPTLFETDGHEIRAYTGWRLGARLIRTLGLADALRVLRVLGEAGGEISRPTAGEKLPLGPTTASLSPGFSRGRFLKGVGGAVVAASLLSAPARLASPAAAAVGTSIGGARVGDAAVGATIPRPANWVLERERFISRGTYGFTLWKHEEGTSNCHGGEPAVRVARVPRLRPGGIEGAVRAKLDELRDLPMRREEVRVGAKRLKGVAIGPIPGTVPSTEIYVASEGRVYQINVYGEGLSEEDRRLLLNLEFRSPSRTVESLRLPDGEDTEALRLSGEAEDLAERETAMHQSVAADAAGQRTFSAAAATPSYREYQVYEGCWTADSTFFFQTQHGMYANERWGPSGTGYTIAGRPNYWGQYTHGSLNYGRCASPGYSNDKFAIDYPLDFGDVLFSPFKSGTVIFAGRNYTHRHYGIFVLIRASNYKYESMSAHLSGLAPGIRKGARVTDATVIGYAGDTGDPTIPVGEPHLHQAFYRYPNHNADGSPYGGAGLQVVYHHYTGVPGRRAGGVYKFGYTANATTKAEGSYISN